VSKCETSNPTEIDLTKVNVIKTEGHTNVVKLTDTMGVIMRYPTMLDDDAPEDQKNTDDVLKNAERSMNLIASCIEVIFDGAKTYETKNFKKEEVMDFIENLSQGMFQKIANFFKDMPALKHDIKFTCTKCGEETSLTIRGVQDFLPDDATRIVGECVADQLHHDERPQLQSHGDRKHDPVGKTGIHRSLD
jgi:hypothetical protein